MNFSYGRMYDNSRQYMQPSMQASPKPFMGAPQGQMSQPLQAPQANYSAIAQQMTPPPSTQPRMGFGIRQPRQGIA